MSKEEHKPLRLYIEREDKDDGSITYHLWEEGGHWIIGLNDAGDEVGSSARRYAYDIVKAVNAYEAMALSNDMPKVHAVCKVLCKSGKFETGEGGCAPLCMSMLGSSRRGCEYRLSVHGTMARKILEALDHA